ncbi:zinc finger MYM-type protein 5-like [Hydra vulgaris]|uniref:Zinc finger MYM-type protein 5-like n=1 Tax=Hydra vulgaris TaxID=6087 RepID=A0ABM4CSB0_HYDVU
MKRVQLSGAQRRKLAKEKEHTISVVKATSRKLTSYLVLDQQQCNPLQSAEDDDKNADDKDENDKINQAIDPGLWIDFSAYDMAYWVDCGPTNCQHHFGPFNKSCRIYAGGKKTSFVPKNNSEQYRREWLLYSPSTGSVYYFVCKLFASTGFKNFADKNGFSDWKNNIYVDNHEQSATHKN